MKMCRANGLNKSLSNKTPADTSTIINSYIAWSTHQADSWWFLYMEHNDLVTADTGGQALGFLLHCTESAQKNINVKAYTRSHIYSHIQRELDNSKTENSPNLVYSIQQYCPQAPRSHRYGLHCQETT